MSVKNILILTNSINGLYSFRRELVEKLLQLGFIVSISSPEDIKTQFFIDIGCNLLDTKIDRRGINPISDIKLIMHYIKIMKKVKPDLVLSYTIKPNLYGGIACRVLKINYIATITGLGTSIVSKGILSKISLFLYKTALKKVTTVFFQNKMNQRLFIEKKIVKTALTKKIPGSGVNLDYHKFEEYPKEDEKIRFLFIGRIMREKGVRELFEAAEIIKNKYSYNVEFHIIGRKEEYFDSVLSKLVENKTIIYHGYQENVHDFIKNCHAIINPSYHEGISNVLLESASTGRPVLASNIPGCMETFDNGISGFSFEPGNVNSLVTSIIRFIELPYEEKKKMGFYGRKKVEREFDRNIVVSLYVNEIEKLNYQI